MFFVTLIMIKGQIMYFLRENQSKVAHWILVYWLTEFHQIWMKPAKDGSLDPSVLYWVTEIHQIWEKPVKDGSLDPSELSHWDSPNLRETSLRWLTGP